MGTSKTAGLPNIKGTFSATNGDAYLDGTLFVDEGWVNSRPWDGTGLGYTKISFNANRLSNIYNDNVTTVQPASLCLNYIIKYI